MGGQKKQKKDSQKKQENNIIGKSQKHIFDRLRLDMEDLEAWERGEYEPYWEQEYD